MATDTQDQSRKRSVLENHLNDLEVIQHNLQTVSAQYADARDTLVAMQAGNELPEGHLQQSLRIGGVSVNVSLPEDTAQLMALVQDAVASLGEEVVRLWGEAHKITTAGVGHCGAAAARARG